MELTVGRQQHEVVVQEDRPDCPARIDEDVAGKALLPGCGEGAQNVGLRSPVKVGVAGGGLAHYLIAGAPSGRLHRRPRRTVAP